MKLAYQTQTKQYNDQSHLVCVKHGFVVNKIHTSVKKTVHKKSIWKSNVTCKIIHENSISMFTIARVLGAILLSTCFVKSWRNTYRTHSEYDWSVYWLTFCLICKLHWFWRSNHYLFGNCVKILAWSLKRSVTLFGSLSKNKRYFIKWNPLYWAL